MSPLAPARCPKLANAVAVLGSSSTALSQVSSASPRKPIFCFPRETKFPVVSRFVSCHEQNARVATLTKDTDGKTMLSICHPSCASWSRYVVPSAGVEQSYRTRQHFKNRPYLLMMLSFFLHFSPWDHRQLLYRVLVRNC